MHLVKSVCDSYKNTNDPFYYFPTEYYAQRDFMKERKYLRPRGDPLTDGFRAFPNISTAQISNPALLEKQKTNKGLP